MSDDIDTFYAKHAAGGPSHVVACIAMRKDDNSEFSVFSTIANARAWADSLSDDDYHGCVFVPYVVDCPEFGNVPKEARQ